MNPAGLARALRQTLDENPSTSLERYVGLTVDLLRRMAALKLLPHQGTAPAIVDVHTFMAAWTATAGQGPQDVFAAPTPVAPTPRFYTIEAVGSTPDETPDVMTLYAQVPEGHAVVDVREISTGHARITDKCYGLRLYIDSRPPPR